MKKSLCFVSATFFLASVSSATSLRELMLTAPDLPAGCHIIPGVFTTGIRTSMLYDYKRYAGAMPPLVKKAAQSFSCGGESAQKGSLLYFEYADASQRDQAELFAGPILAREENLPHPIETREWPQGFVVVSFKNPPPLLLEALDHKLKSGAAPAMAASLPTPSVPVTATPRAASAPMIKTMGTTWSSSPALPKPSVVAPTEPVRIDQMATAGPGAPLTAEPPMDTTHALVAPPETSPALPSVPPSASLASGGPPPAPKPVPVRRKPVAVAAAPAKIPNPYAPIVSPPPVTVAALVSPPSPSPLSPAVVAPMPSSVKPETRPLSTTPAVHGLEDVAASVLTNFAGKLDCANPDIKEQGRMVCSVLNDFVGGTRPDIPSNPSTILLGPVYTVDEYGRLTDMHYDVLAGSDLPDQLSFFALISSGGTQDFEIQSLMDALKSKKDLPVNATLQHIQELLAKKRMPVVPTTGASVAILPGGPRRIYIRKSGDHWVLVGPSGATSDTQIRSSFVLATLY